MLIRKQLTPYQAKPNSKIGKQAPKIWAIKVILTDTALECEE
ncbi:hypothetical protein [Prevotella falsenii]|nr:hypothetical protein [Prevotella falsenii]